MKLLIEFLSVIIWPATVITVILLFRQSINKLLSRVKKAKLPGGISVETFPEKLEEARILSSQIQNEQEKQIQKNISSQPLIPLTEANSKMIKRGLTPSPSGLDLSYYQNLAERDPNIALAGLRIEMDAMLKNLAKGYKIAVSKSDSASSLVRKLRDNGAITSKQAELAKIIIRLCNAALHGLKVTDAQVKEILDIASVLRDQYISWLSWGFQKD